MSENIIEITDAEFESEVLQASKTVLVDFWAPWCGPCKAMMPAIESVAQSHGDQLKCVKINVDDNSETPAKYGVRGIPTLLLVKDGAVLATQVGAMSVSQLNEWIAQHGN